MKISRTYLLWTLGLLTAFGPYITDLYLSSLPEQVEYFGTTPALVQLGLTTSMAGFPITSGARNRFSSVSCSSSPSR